MKEKNGQVWNDQVKRHFFKHLADNVKAKKGYREMQDKLDSLRVTKCFYGLQKHKVSQQKEHSQNIRGTHYF